ncbi:hypothetical protein LR48_Vigan02g053400 [Vigna angularis]|uniref:Uncharacterized protein n=1 Tax=Phaseolus angularis TaxID=3914 RepID=A0A0L9TW25_PHAAN|nr:hypothetical protein LR48_Vigan02g053400 [Vigna angularis]
MASGGCDPPLPPSGKSDNEKGKKKSYVVKLLSRLNNVNVSSTQPSTPTSTFTPTSTSTGRSVPPPFQVPGFTPTPPFIPPSLEVLAFTPSLEQVVVDQWTSLSPHVGSNPTTPTNIAPSPRTVDAGPHSSSAANEFEDVSHSRPIITPVEEACTPLDPTEEERLRNQCWLEVAGGRYKGHVYGIENIIAQDDCVNSYIQQTQTSSSQQPIVEDIFNLQTRVSTHDDQLRQMTSQFQGFIGVMMQYLPPPTVTIAQQFLQSQDQPQTNVQPQQPQQVTNHPEDGNVYRDY